MAGLSKKDTYVVIHHLRGQGVTVDPTDKGWLVKYPDGGTTSFHLSHSDHRSTLNLRADVRRHGYTWPFDHQHTPKPKGSPVTAEPGDPYPEPTKAVKRPQKATVGRVRRALTGLPDTVTVSEVARAAGVEFSTAQRVLYWLGYRYADAQDSASGPHQWRLDPAHDRSLKETLPMAPPPPPVDSPTGMARTEEPPPLSQREFIDTAESWTLNLTSTVGTMTVLQLVAAMKAAGLEMEVRVWKR